MTTRAAGRPAVAESAARATLMLVLVVAAFSRTWVRLLVEAGWGWGNLLLLAAPAGAVLTAATLIWRRRPELPIHDRQSDKIVGTVILAIALMIQWLVVPRYASSYVLLHVDVAAAWAFLLGGSVFVFGLRRTGHFWPAWVLLAVASPGAIRLGTYLLGGGLWGVVVVVSAVLFTAPVAVVLAGKIRARGRGGARDRTRWTGPAVSAREAWRSVPLVVAVAVVLALAPLPQTAEDRLVQGPPGPVGAGQVIPAGWTERTVEDFPWAPRMYGPTATMQRQLIRADASRADWDALRRPRQVVVQTLTVTDPGILDAFPLEMTYDLGTARVSPPSSVELARGVSSRYRTVVDDERLLTWSLMSFVWELPTGRVQRVSLLTVDNHEYDAQFPSTVPGTRSTSARLISLLLRGQASITAEDPQQKDMDMLTELGSELVEAQWTTQ